MVLFKEVMPLEKEDWMVWTTEAVGGLEVSLNTNFSFWACDHSLEVVGFAQGSAGSMKEVPNFLL